MKNELMKKGLFDEWAIEKSLKRFAHSLNKDFEDAKTIRLLEKDLMRDLTEKEKEIVKELGWEEFLFNHLGFSEDDFKELRAIKNLVSAFYTQDEKTYQELLKNCPEGAYFVLMDIVKSLNDLKPCKDPYTSEDKEENNETEEVPAETQEEEYTDFLEDLYTSLATDERLWLDHFKDIDDKKVYDDLFDLFKREKDTCTKDLLYGTMTDAVKDAVVEDLVKKLENGDSLEMTNAEFLEVSDYLCDHKDKFYLNNDNGKVTLKLF